MLIVEADSTAGALPSEWRLVWCADADGLAMQVVDGAVGCSADSTVIAEMTAPVTHADSVANEVTARFCLSGSGAARFASYLIDVPAGATAKLKLVTLDSDGPGSGTVLESNEATINGGLTGEYPPTILALESDHSTVVAKVTLQGADLQGIDAVKLWSQDLRDDVPLTIMQQSAGEIRAEASVPVPLIDTDVRVGTGMGEYTTGSLPNDMLGAFDAPTEAFFADPDTNIYPKDFAFINAPTLVNGVWENLFHIYYIRHSKLLSGAANEVELGHAWSRDLRSWNQNLHAFGTGSASAWDGQHVWAPSIVRRGLEYFMFYTGVSASGDQSIGFATASDVDTLDAPGHWQRQTTPTVQAENAQSWVWQHHPAEFRDPFVMVDPENPFTRFLMFFCASTASDTNHLAVGVFRSAPGSLTSWADVGVYPATDFAHTQISRLESPHVFADAPHHDPSQQLDATWRIMYTDGNWVDSARTVFFSTKAIGSPLTNRTIADWSATPTTLFDYLHLSAASPEFGFQASEILEIGNVYYWAAYDGRGLLFRKLDWGGSPHFWLTTADLVAVGDRPRERPIALRLSELRPGGGSVRFLASLPGSGPARLEVFDVMGRSVRVLVKGVAEAGTKEFDWDGRESGGRRVGSGIYFARLVSGNQTAVARVPLLR